MNRLILTVVAALGLSGCILNPPNTPHPPQPTTRFFEVTLESAPGTPIDGLVTANGQSLAVHFAGRISDLADCPTPLVVTVTSPGFQPFSRTYSECGNIQTVVQLLANPPPPLPSAGERGPLHVDGLTFRRTDNSIFKWKGADDFALFARFLAGQDIQPILTERILAGATVFRVFTMFDGAGIGAAAGTGALDPNSRVDFYAKLRTFTDLLASRGARVELVALADADARPDGTGGLLPTVALQQAHLTRILAAVTGAWNVFVEWANEPFKNATHVAELTGDCRAAGVLCAYGWGTLDRGQRSLVHLDYLTIHDHERKDEWPRTARALDELREGFSWNLDDPSCVPFCSQHPDNADDFEGVHIPVVGDEPMGFAEIARGGARAGRQPDEANTPVANLRAIPDAMYYAGTAQLMGAGSTFHSDDGVASRLWSPVQKAAAEAWFWAANWVPAEAQLAPYQRGGDCGTGGIGNMPIEHCDLGTGAASQALRSFAKFAFAAEWVIRIRGIGPAVPRDGWVIRAEPRKNFLELTHP